MVRSVQHWYGTCSSLYPSNTQQRYSSYEIHCPQQERVNCGLCMTASQMHSTKQTMVNARCDPDAVLCAPPGHDLGSQWNKSRPLDKRCYPSVLHDCECPHGSSMTFQHCHPYDSRRASRFDTISRSEASPSKRWPYHPKMETFEDQFHAPSDEFYAQLHASAPSFGDSRFLDDDLDHTLQTNEIYADSRALLGTESVSLPAPPLSLQDAKLVGEANGFAPAVSSVPQDFVDFDKDDGLRTGPMSVPIDEGMWNFPSCEEKQIELAGRFQHDQISTGPLLLPRRLDPTITGEGSRTACSSTFAVLPEQLTRTVRRFDTAASYKPQLLLEQPFNHAIGRLSIDRIGSRPFGAQVPNGNFDHLDNQSIGNQLILPRYSRNHCALSASYDETMAGLPLSTTNTTNTPSMSNYPPIPETSLTPSRSRLHEGVQDFTVSDDDFKFYDNDPSLPHTNGANNIFFGFDPTIETHTTDFDFITDPLAVPTNFRPILQPDQVPLPITPQNTISTNDDSARRDTSRDQELLELRDAGYSYREIKQNFGFKEAESTLRGRYRTLTKAKEHRVRKPEWSVQDIDLLFNTVQDQTQDAATLPTSAFRYSNDGLPILTDQANLNKVSWKKVAETMAEQGAYHYGNATVKKKYVQIRNEKLFGVNPPVMQLPAAIDGNNDERLSGYGLDDGYGDPFGGQ